MVKTLLAGRQGRAERAFERRNIDLEDAALSDKTRVRYYSALRKLLPTVEACPSMDRLDVAITQWIHSMWKSGEPLLTIGDALSALHFFQPSTRRIIPHSWKMFKVWRKLEVPMRAPPLTWQLISSMTAYCLDKGHLEMACILALGFHCLLRTGEALALSFNDILIGANTGICRLVGTKSGKRNAANEVISIQHPAVLDILRALRDIQDKHSSLAIPIWSGSPSQFRQCFKRLMAKYDLESLSFRPYSLRRGGATHLFQCTGSMEAALMRGRWESARVAKVYISDGLSFLPGLKFSAHTQKMLRQFSL